MHIKKTDTAPETLVEAIQALIDMIDDKSSLKSDSEDSWVAIVHHGLGTWIRNIWGLWNSAGQSPLVKSFHDLGIYHADDMSGIILSSFWRHVNYHPLQVDEQVKHYQDYWRSIGVDIKAEMGIKD